jgi:LacI family transcriptional regulator
MENVRRIVLFLANEWAPCRGILRGVYSYAWPRHRWVFNQFHPAAEAQECADKLRAWQPDGVIFYPSNAALLPVVADLPCPVVPISQQIPQRAAPTLGINEEAVGEMAAQHFLERGFRHFAFVGRENHRLSRPREKGFRDALRRYAYTCASRPDFLPLSEDSVENWEKQSAAMRSWLLELPRPTGIFVWNDGCGVRLSEACLRAGLRVPEDVALLGVDDDDLLCRMAHPPLSSVKLPFEAVGFAAATMLDALMSGGSSEAGPFLPEKVVTRVSTDILAIEDEDVVRVLKFIREHATEPINAQTLERLVPLSRRAIERRFRRALGRSPLEELQRVRVERAKELLSQKQLPISAVAARSGFGSATYLSRIFRRETGLTPSAFRKRQQTPSS